MAATTLRGDERIGLAVAVALHAGLLAFLALRTDGAQVVMPPERMEVTLSDDVAMTSTAPKLDAPAPDEAPTLGEPEPPEPPEPVAEELPAEPEPLPPPPKPQPQPKPVPKPTLKPVAKPTPPKPATKPVAKPTARPPPPKPAPPKPAAKPASKPAAKPAAQSSPKPAAKPAAKPGASRIGNDFLDGAPTTSSASRSTGQQAATIGPQVRASLGSAIRRQLKPHWTAPQGVEAELLVTKVRFRLNRDGSLAGEPQILSTTGQTDANGAQVERHREQAVRAVKLAAPFNLPEEFYAGWQVVTINFDRGLSQ